MQPSLPWPAEKFDAPGLNSLLTDMRDSMIAANGAGLAAPQIGENVRVVIFEVKDNPRYPGVVVPYTVLINPAIIPLSDQIEEGWEGCLSVPGLRGVVPRYSHLRYRGFDAAGKPIDRVADGFHARVVQHECDHLDGILYPMRVRDFRRFGFIETLFPNQEIKDD